MMNGRNSDTQHVQVQPSLDFSVSTDFPKRYDFDAHLYNDVKMVDDAYVNASNSDTLMSHSEDGSEESTQPKNVIQGSDIEQHPVLEEDQKETSHATEIVRSSEDGYNWRKYGQKQVKGCEYPRSYYKCTQPNCLVKKKVERSHDGQITAIIYKGSHNHLKPHNIHRGSALSSDEMLDMGEANESGVKVDGGLVWRNIQSRIRNAQQGLDWKGDFQERASADSTGTQLSDPISTSKAKSLSMLEAEDTPELSSTLASHDGNEDGTTQTLASHEDDFEHNESQSKRRKKESNLVESNLPPRAVREPRVVIQIETEVDILDDGYRWRKYGQKVVKGNPNPR
ncbi:putative transcription factor WRKY family [Lupinus albus]|uniref:Putative transcription factor WRKY family n=1 Tax=Lupinus albus TaxID=3870 RepID=A0A6A4QWD4_LUPAL|nr:putative transcription factor WRKY family [Lupinus albus]